MTTDEQSTAESEADPERIPQDDMFDILGNKRRRQMLLILDSAPGPVSMSEFITRIAAAEEGTSPESVSETFYKRIQVASLQTHLPKMESAGVIERDQDERTVELTRAGATLIPYLRCDDPRSWVAADVIESSAAVTVLVDLPGFDRSDVQIETGAKQVGITASRGPRAEGEDVLVRNERPTSVQRTVDLPVAVSVDDPTVEFHDGVLSLTFTKLVTDRSVALDL